MVAVFEAGAHLGTAHKNQHKNKNTKKKKKKPVKEQLVQVRSLMGAGLGLLAFMLGFGFKIGQSHFERRSEVYLLEVNAISTAYLSAGLLPLGAAGSAKALLRDFVDERIAIEEDAAAGRLGEVEERIQASDDLLQELWLTAEGLALGFGGEVAGGFTGSVLALIEADVQRKNAEIYNRVPPSIWAGLYVVAILSMLVMGYHAGLTRARSRVATWTLALTFSSILMLAVDLDRPNMSLFQVDHQQMLEVQQYMSNN
jgi:hypothetical protein